MNNLKLLTHAQKIVADYFQNPSPKTAWETAFTSLGLTHYDWDAAAKLTANFFKLQQPNGCLPHFYTQQTKENITQPPIWGFLLWRLYQQSENKSKAVDFLRELYPKVLHFHQYLYDFRDPNEEGLCHLENAMEDVLTDNPHWLLAEKAIGEKAHFKIQDPFFNTILVKSNEALIEVADVLKKDVSNLVQWNELTVHSFNEKLWDDEYGIYNAWDLVANKAIPMEGISGLLPLFGGIPDIEQALQMLDLINSNAFIGSSDNAVFLCPTLSLECANVNVDKKATGAISLDLNWLLFQGCQLYETPEFMDVAEQIKAESLQLLSKNSFHQYFNPYKNNIESAGLGNKNCLISASTLLNWLL